MLWLIGVYIQLKAYKREAGIAGCSLCLSSLRVAWNISTQAK